jgi:hypothetical protein
LEGVLKFLHWHPPAVGLLLRKGHFMLSLYAYFIFDKLLLPETFYTESLFHHLLIEEGDQKQLPESTKKKVNHQLTD